MTDWHTIVVYPADHARWFQVLKQGFVRSPALSGEKWIEPIDELVFWPSTEFSYLRTDALLQLRPAGEFEAMQAAREEARCREREVERLADMAANLLL
jgi:hypothetical protein